MVTVTLPDGAQIGNPASFAASTDIRRPYRWQWFRNGKEVPGASSACVYRTWPLRPEDFDASYHVQVFGLFGDIEESVPVKLSSAFGSPKITRSDPVPAIIDLAGEQYKVISKSGDIVTLQRVPGAVPPPVQSVPVEHTVTENILPVPNAATELPTPAPAPAPEPTPAPTEPVPTPAEPAPATEPPTPTPQGGTT